MLARQISGVMLARILGLGLVFVSQVVLARKLSIEEFGVVVYLLTILATAGLVAKFGLDTVALRFVSTYRAQQAFGPLKGIIISTLFFVGVFGSVVYIGLVQVTNYFGILSENYTPYIPLLLGLLPLLPLQNLIASILRGFDAQLWAELVDTSLRYFSILIGLTVLWLSDLRTDVGSVLFIYTGATALSVLFGLGVILRQWPKQAIRVRSELRLQEWGSAGAALWLSGGLYMLMNQADLLMLGQMGEPENVGRYAVASRLTGLVGMALGSVMIVVAPKLSAIHGRNEDRAEMQNLLTSAARITFILIMIGASILVIFGKPLLSIFGREFLPAYTPLLILTASRVVEAYAGPVGQLLAMVGKHTLVAVLLVVPTIMNIALNFYFIPRFGESGAALATLISVIAWNVTLLIASGRKLGLDPSMFSVIRKRLR